MKFGLRLPPQISIYGAFFVYSFCMGSIYPRLPVLQYSMNAGEGALGLALVGIALGTLIALTFAGPMLEKLGHRAVLLSAIPLLSVCYAVATLAPNPTTLFVLFVPVGLVIGCIEIIVNLEADRVEHAIGRRIMNRSHAFWSMGFFAAGIVGASIAQTGLTPQLHLALMIPIVTIATLLLLGRFQPAAARSGEHEQAAAPRFAMPSGPIMLLVIVCLPAMIMEGAYIDWSAIYMSKEFLANPFWAGFAVALGAGAQAVARFFADGFVERWSPRLVARTMLVILAIGALLLQFSPVQWLAYVGIAMLGVGSSGLFPLAMSAAAQRTDRPAALNVASLAQISFSALLLGPPLLGFVAEHVGIRWAFGIGLPLAIIALAFTNVFASRRVAKSAD
jgi:MFS family permease